MFNNVTLELEEIDEVPFEENFRRYRAYVPIEHLPNILTTFTVEPVSTDLINFPLVFKPSNRDIKLD